MKILLVDNAHIFKMPDGRMFTPSIYGDSFFLRYLDVFDEVCFLAKTKHVEYLDETQFVQIHLEGHRFSLIELPWYQGLLDMTRKLFGLVLAYRNAGKDCDCVIYRVCQIESYFSFFLKKARIPVYLEVVNDPATFISMPRLFRLINAAVLKLMLRQAQGASFVTNRILQEKYLPKNRSDYFIEGSYSSVELPHELFGVEKNFEDIECRIFKIVHVANFIADDTKGHVALLKTMRLLTDRRTPVRLHIIGDGPYVPQLKRIAAELGVTASVDFVGRFHDRAALLRRLAECDLFLYPTELEGLPRALIESMAVGLPCLSTPIAGIPELLDDCYLFSPDDHCAFADKICELIGDPAELEQMSRINISVARRYEASLLRQKRRDFYSKIRLFLEQRHSKGSTR